MARRSRLLRRAGRCCQTNTCFPSSLQGRSPRRSRCSRSPPCRPGPRPSSPSLDSWESALVLAAAAAAAAVAAQAVAAAIAVATMAVGLRARRSRLLRREGRCFQTNTGFPSSHRRAQGGPRRSRCSRSPPCRPGPGPSNPSSDSWESAASASAADDVGRERERFFFSMLEIGLTSRVARGRRRPARGYRRVTLPTSNFMRRKCFERKERKKS